MATVTALNTTVEPAVCDGAHDGVVRIVVPARQLLPVPRHHEQAVVDGQAEAHARS